MSNKKKFLEKLTDNGYYIALIGCALAIGLCAWLYYGDLQKDPADPSVPVDGTQDGLDIPAIATDPTLPSKPSDPLTMKTGYPVEGTTVREHALDRLVYDPTTRDWRVHDGIDIAADSGTPVTAAADGVVYTTYTDEIMGTTVVISHAGGYMTTYSSLDAKLEVAPGDQVTLGQTIGYVGRSALMETALGHHVHFCVSLGDESVDPAEFFALG